MTFVRREVLFDIPVYRITEEKRIAEAERLAAKDVRYKLNPQRDGSWAFNEVIAWVSAWQDGSAIKYHAFEREIHTYRRNFDRNRPLFLAGKVIEDLQLSEKSSAEIWGCIQESLRVIQDNYAGRFVDLRQVDRWGPHVDWRAVLNFGKL